MIVTQEILLRDEAKDMIEAWWAGEWGEKSLTNIIDYLHHLLPELESIRSECKNSRSS